VKMPTVDKPTWIHHDGAVLLAPCSHAPDSKPEPARSVCCSNWGGTNTDIIILKV
jgi:hypothetical protein